MELRDILNADMATAGAGLRAGWAWWVDELRSMVPGVLRGSRRSGSIIAEMRGTGAAYQRDGRPLAGPPSDGRVALAVPRAQALMRETVLPRLSRADTRRLIALDLDRLTPVDPASAVFDFENAPGEPPPGRQLVRLAVITRAAALTALARADALGLVPHVLCIADGAGGVAFDFLPALAEGGPRAPWWVQARTWWMAAAALLLANLAFAVWRDMADVARLSDTVAAQSDAVQLAQRAKARVRAEDVRRAAWAERRAAQDPLPPLAAATLALPAPVWAQRLGWDGHALRLTGYTSAAVDPVSLLRRAPIFSAVHASTSDVAPTMPQFQPFDLTATVAPRVRTMVNTTTTTTLTTGVRR